MVITGPSAGVGKDTVVKELEKEREFTRIVTYTTREQRNEEIDGVHYHFITKEEFQQKEKEGFFLEMNEYKENLYGSPKKEILGKLVTGEEIILRVDINGAKRIKEQIPQAVIIFLTAPFKDLWQRMAERGDPESEIEKKLQIARKEMKKALEFDYLVVNKQGKLEEAIEEILKIIDKEKSSDEP